MTVAAVRVLDDFHSLAVSFTDTSPTGGRRGRVHCARAAAMGRPKHGAAAVDAIIHNEEVVLAGKLMLIYAVQAPLVGR